MITSMYAFDESGQTGRTAAMWPAQNTPVEFFGSDFDDQLTEIALLRNECAHRSLMRRDKAELARELIRQKLDSILAYYN